MEEQLREALRDVAKEVEIPPYRGIRQQQKQRYLIRWIGAPLVALVALFFFFHEPAAPTKSPESISQGRTLHYKGMTYVQSGDRIAENQLGEPIEEKMMKGAVRVDEDRVAHYFHIIGSDEIAVAVPDKEKMGTYMYFKMKKQK